MFPSDYLIFLQIILFLFITPGLPRVVIVSHTLNYGLKKSVWTAVGDVSANIIQGILVVFLIGSFLSDNPEILYYLKWAGILYIVYLAYDTYTAKISSIESGEQSSKSTFSFYKDGFMVAGLSPKAIIFFGTIFSSFINFESNVFSQFIILMITYVVLDFLTLMIYGMAAEKISVWLKRKPKVLNTISACVLLIIALYVAATQNFS
jgi:homoserine/homoserine lactone efflux protein